MIYVVAGTRPNFMKVAPICRELAHRNLPLRLMHTGQHFDAQMSAVFFRDLEIPDPHVRLTAGGGSHAEQTAAVLVGIERDLIAHRPNMVLVVGDVTSTFAAALAASKLGIPVVHVEAGLRSGDWTMPEEINRVLTDQLSDLLLIPSEDARPNLLREGIAPERIVFVGNVMIDSLHFTLRAENDALARHGLLPHTYALCTLHRPANVDGELALSRTLAAVEAIAKAMPVLFPVHPRTAHKIKELGLLSRLTHGANLKITEPIGYRDFTTLMKHARLVATDSGGIQEETTALGIPCLTMREGTERPITVTEGTNTVVGTDPGRMTPEVEKILRGEGKRGNVPRGWDGHAAVRVVDALVALAQGSPPLKTDGPRA